MSRPLVVSLALAWLGSLGACGNGGTPVADVPLGPCGEDLFGNGEIIDWDTTDASFCGVLNARVALRGTQSPSDTTDPNGRFELCVARQAQALLDVTHSPAASGCVGVTGSYPVRGVLVARQEVIDRSATFSARAMTQARQDAMFTQIGQAYDAARAQLVVHVVGAPRAVTLSASHAAVQRFDGTTWAAGNTGAEVFFPNVAPGSAEVTVAGGAVGTGTVMLEAGAYTYLTVITN